MCICLLLLVISINLNKWLSIDILNKKSNKCYLVNVMVCIITILEKIVFKITDDYYVYVIGIYMLGLTYTQYLFNKLNIKKLLKMIRR